jgi:DNA-binding transcriptional MerR regulator
MLTFSIVKRTRRTPLYNIGVASRLCGLPVWTLRWIEKNGLVSPRRTEGRQRLFSEEEMELLLLVRQLMEQDVNLPGIRVILKMRVQGTFSLEKGNAKAPARRRFNNG